ncbi:MAG: glycoside hydrolase family 88 protein [Vicinamibacteria bacterium]|nr:glycoside hydrolase family 88 protein [Vicinamibacteria bacterium]
MRIRRLAFCLLGVWLVLPSAVWSQNASEKKSAPETTEAAGGRRAGARSIQDVVLAVARRQLRELADGEYRRGSWDEVRTSRDPKGVEWVYPWGVTLLGMLHAGEVTGDSELSAFVIKHNEIVARYWKYLVWVQEAFSDTRPEELQRFIRSKTIHRLMRLGSLDNAGAMSGQMIEGFLRHGAEPTPEQTALLRLTTDYVSNRQSRLPDGTFWRPESNATLWIDDLFMSCSLLTRWYEHTRDRRFVDDAARQILGMARLQQDKDGLWYHAHHIARTQTSPYKWGRANGWAMVATVEALSVLPEDHPDRPPILSILRKHIDGVKKVQASSGLWRQVLDHEELWEETSCSSMFAFSIARAVRRGWIPPENLEISQKAFRGVKERVSEDGRVSGTSEGTLIGEDLEYYAGRRQPVDDWHAPGPVLLAGAELIAVEKSLRR